MRHSTITFRPSTVGTGIRLEAAQFLAERRGQIFAFFSDAFQLEKLTPPWLNFAVRSPRPILLEKGTRIDYRLRLHGIPIRWQSRIDVWEPPTHFVDVQTRGPYRRWRHEHLFEEVAGGTICRDIVEYAVLGGCLIERSFVRNDVLRIFEYRQRKLEEVFPPSNAASIEPCCTAAK